MLSPILIEMPCILHELCHIHLQVATEWLFSVPQDVLEKHVSSDPNTPTHDEERHHEKPVEEKRVLAPRRVPLTVRLLKNFFSESYDEIPT